MANNGKARPTRSRPERPAGPERSRRPAGKRPTGQEQPSGQMAPQRAPRKKRSNNRRKHGGVLLRLLTMLVIVVVFVLGISIFFKVNEIQVVGNQKYAAEDVIAASGIQKGDNLMTISKGSAAGKIMAVLPYVEQVSISRVLPDTVILEIRESDAAYAVSAEDGTSWLVSASGKVLEQAPVSAADYPKLTGVTIQSPEVGQQLVCEQTENWNAARTVMAELETTDFISQITEINVEKTYDIVIWYGTQFEVQLGGSDEMAYKVQYLASILDQLDGEQGGTIDLTLEEKNTAVFTPWQNSQELNAETTEETAENS